MRRVEWTALALALVLTGCSGHLLPRPVNIAEFRLMRTMGVDAGEEDIRLTLCGDVQRESTGGETRAPLLLTGEGITLTAAAAEAETSGEGRLEYGHLEECVIGEALARRGLAEVTDYLERDSSIRTGTKLFLLRGEAGSALASACDDHSAPTQTLTSLSEDTVLGGEGWPYLLRTFLADSEDNGIALLPVLNQRLEPEGLAWMVHQRLGGWLEKKESRGVALLTGQDQQDTFEVPLGSGMAGVRLVRSRCQWRPVYDEEGALTGAKASVQVFGKVTQLPPGGDPERDLERLRRLWLAQVGEICEAALQASVDSGADFLHLRRTLLCRDPLHAGEIDRGWERFPDLRLTVEVEGEMGKSYDTDRSAERGS